MARKKSSGDGGGRAKTQQRAKKAEVRTVDAEGVEEVQGGMTFEDGIAITTTVLLIVSIVFVLMVSGRYPTA